MSCTKTCGGCCDYIIFEDKDPKRLIDRVNKYRAMGHSLESLWYNYSWLFWVRYYAKLKLNQQSNCCPKILFGIGPVSNV